MDSKLITKVLVVGDLHGRHEYASNAIDKFNNEDYDKLVFIGDYADSYTRTNEDILRCYKLVIEAKLADPNNVILLIGNHELHYMYGEGEYRCSGYRADLFIQLNPYLRAYSRLFQVAYQLGNYLFTHAGVQRQWYLKHFDILNKWAEIVEVDITDQSRLADILNIVSETADRQCLHEVGNIRGGWADDRGGITWCDRTEMLSRGPLVGYHQIVGHTPHKFITRVNRFEGGKQYKNTSVTFIDVLDKKEQFLTLDI